MFIVQAGRVRVFQQSEDKDVAIAEMEKGDFFGEMSLLEGVPRNVSAEAIDGTDLIEINSTTFDRMIRSNIEIAVRMLRKLSGRLQKAELQIAGRRTRPAASLAAAAPATPPLRAELQSVPALEHAAAAAGIRFGQAQQGPRPASRPPARSSDSPGAEPARTLAGDPPIAASGGMRPQAATPPSSFSHGSLSATRPPSPSMMAGSQRLSAAASVAPPSTPARVAAPQGARLVSETGETVFPLSKQESLMGRYDPVTETQPEVDLTLIDIKRSVSRRHARVTAAEGLYYLTEEVGALNGTFINGVRLTTGMPSPLKNEDRVNLGTVNLIFRM